MLRPGTASQSKKTQVDLILAKPNYRHQKKQKEQARKLRQAEKQTRRLAARPDEGGDNPASEPGQDPSLGPNPNDTGGAGTQVSAET